MSPDKGGAKFRRVCPQKGAEKGSELKEIELPQPSYERLKQLK
jgi:hypothetical protein